MSQDWVVPDGVSRHERAMMKAKKKKKTRRMFGFGLRVARTTEWSSVESRNPHFRLFSFLLGLFITSYVDRNGIVAR